jgi:hypothetical protein
MNKIKKGRIISKRELKYNGYSNKELNNKFRNSELII